MDVIKEGMFASAKAAEAAARLGERLFGEKQKFNSQICTTREQSERLIALGLKKETADMAHAQSIVLPRYKVLQVNYWHLLSEYEERTFFPAWSLHRLIEIVDDECVIHLDNFTIAGRLFEVYDNLFDNIIDCIEWLIKEGYFNKKYLENEMEEKM